MKRTLISKKRIAIVGVKTVPYTGGIEYVVENTAPFLDSNKFEVIIYVRKKYYQSYDIIPTVQIICLPHLSGKNTEALSHTFLSILHGIFVSKVDVFFFHAVVLGVLTFIPKLFFKKVILQTHGLDWKREKWGKIAKSLIRVSTHAAARIPDKTICVCEGDRDYFRMKFNKMFQIVPNGVSIPTFSESNEIFVKYKLQPKFYILFMARLVPEKGAHTLIAAFNHLVKKNKINREIKLVVAGDTNYYDDYYYSLKKHVNERVVFTGFVTGDDKYTLLKNALCFIQPSTIEGMSTGILEAMGMGVLPIVSDIKENVDVVKKYGITFQSGSVIDLSNKIVLATRKSSQEKNLKMSNYTKLNYSWQHTIRELNNALDSL